MTMRVACGLTLSLAFVIPAHALSCNSNPPPLITVPPGAMPSFYAKADYYSVLNAGTVSYVTTPATHDAINVGSANGTPDSCGFTFTNDGSVSITAPSSDTGPTDFRILNLYALGTDKSKGETPDTGGQAGPITVNLGGSVRFDSQIASFAYGAYGVWIQSLGGKGDDSEKEGTNGASGGAAGAVSASISSASLSVQTASTGTGAAIRIQQVAGRGGEGNNDGRGGSGGTAQAQTITLTDSSLTTSGPNLAGLVAIQTGGPGGNGGLEDRQQNSPGGPGGAALGIALSLAPGSRGNTIATNGVNAAAVSLLAQGGTGGTGADTGGGLQFNSLAGSGGGGATPGTISLRSDGTQSLTTSGASSPGMLITAQGGAGGNGGSAQSGGGGGSGSGGAGGGGGIIDVALNGAVTLRTTGDRSPALALRSLGGVGGNGGTAASNSEITSGNGGKGGDGGSVQAALAAATVIGTSGDSAHGVVIQSAGAQGGEARNANGPLSTAGAGGNGGGASGISLTHAGAITTTGTHARGILVQSIAGDGGPGANANALVGSPGAGGSPGSIALMSVNNAGTITTAGNSAQGILAQSIGGGGGAGGSTSGDIFSAAGGAGIAGATGGAISVGHTGRLATSGSTAAGLIAQSIGGGGGDGGDGSAIFSSKGGSGGPGGNGGAVTTTLGGSISTTGGLSHGAIAQSIGGGGGNGGNASAAGTVATYTLGGTGGGGGSGGTVSTTAQGATLTAAGSGANGILAQSIGGGGGSGGNASAVTATGGFSFAAAIGGSGGNGGDGGAVTVSLGSATVTTGSGSAVAPPVDAIGVLAQSIGGGGGAGGGANALAVAISRPSLPDSPTVAIAAAYANGGTGGGGGQGGVAVINLGNGAAGTSGGATLRTDGAGSHGAVAQSIGGGGGQGGDSSAMAGTIGSVSQYGPQDAGSTSVKLALAMGGSAASGGSGNTANVNAGGSGPVSILTTGDYAFGLVAQSVGGGGGNAGLGASRFNAIGNSTTFDLTMSLGASGGSGNNGGQAGLDIGSGATIRTSGSGAIGVLAQSIGGGGGTATGGTLGIGPIDLPEGSSMKGTVASTISLGRTGGTGGSGGAISVTNDGSITTVGNDAPGLLAQSIGGGGGIGGSAGTDAGGGGALSRSPAPGGGSRTMAAEAPSDSDVSLDASLNLTVGGTGGSAGNGGSVLLKHSGRVTTSGDHAPGLVAQSIGGGGGRGGTAFASDGQSSLSYADGALTVKAALTLGGVGGTSGSGGDVTINLVGGAGVTTGLAGQGGLGSGLQSIGILAQSIGGGGGTAVDGTGPSGGASSAGGSLSGDAALTIGAHGASGGGGSVTLPPSSGSTPITVTTYGESGHGIVLQSIGAGGGLTGAGSTGPAGGASTTTRTIDLRIGGGLASSGNGGNVLVNNPILNIRTAGMGAYGLIAQSVGGGGGLATGSGVLPSLSGLGGQGASGDGGSITVNLPANATIATSGLGAHGLVAQSVGGGGGIAAGYQAGITPSLVDPKTFGTSSGDGGSVFVTSLADITTTGPGAFGILAQSVGRGGGLGTIGSQFYAGSMGDPSGSAGLAGLASLILQGTISATGENAVGVFAQSVNGRTVSANTVTVELGYVAPAQVTGGSGQGAGIWIDSGNASNRITVGEGSSVSALSNLAINYTGGSGVNVTNDGTIIGSTRLGSNAYTLTNSGTLKASAADTGQAVITGSFVQMQSGRLTTRADFAAQRAGQFVVTGDATLAGTVQASLASVVANSPVPVLTVQGRTTGSLSAASTALFDFAVVPSTTQAGQHLNLVATGSRLADARFALTPGRQAAAGYLDRVFTAGTPQFGTLFAALDRAAASPGDYGQHLGQLGPRSSLSVGAWRSQNAAFAVNAAMSCPIFAANTAFLTEGTCTYARLGGHTAVANGDGDRSRLHADNTILQVGGQGEVAPGWFLGGALAYENGRISASDGVHGIADVGHAVLTLKRQEGPWLLTGAVFGSLGNIDLRRSNSLPGFGGTGLGSTAPTTLGGRIRAAYTVAFEDLYIRPFLNLDVIHSRLGPYTEAGLGAFGLRYEASEQVTAVVTPAIEFGLRKDLSENTVLRSFISAGVDVRTDNQWRTTTRLIGAPTTLDGFTTVVPQARAAARIGAGLQLFAGDTLDLRMQYDGSFSDRAASHGGFLTFSYRMSPAFHLPHSAIPW
ncbi:hypothetical protein ASF53_21140 [Methylobacterium sp. Leaf123]|uniref:autotransporter outer membrane beta-barrel domain-containing protein n=1 Tax=Methylobacterium sp. Leaf123 TaxID=1736264 RepID=UPI0006FF734C|nr:autotransporter outer membrane beta-barrel domain-containing protein [Methylobacterium sp. Leaf123]KQQ26438.1 hypothetical protein ASF53_21140 [Methylobacterium sp. Leaf123]